MQPCERVLRVLERQLKGSDDGSSSSTNPPDQQIPLPFVISMYAFFMSVIGAANWWDACLELSANVEKQASDALKSQMEAFLAARKSPEAGVDRTVIQRQLASHIAHEMHGKGDDAPEYVIQSAATLLRASHLTKTPLPRLNLCLNLSDGDGTNTTNAMPVRFSVLPRFTYDEQPADIKMLQRPYFEIDDKGVIVLE
jgi:hypothetical protein